MSSDDENARRFVERHFPEVSRFLASENPAVSQLPTFGPTEVFGGVDDLQPAVAVVRVAMALTREQLSTALGIAFAEIAADRTVESLTDAEVRNEIELHLAAQAIHSLDMQMERDAGRDWPADIRRVLDVIAAKADQAYAARVPDRRTQDPVYGDGTVTVDTLDHGRITMSEPAWCMGHDGQPVLHRADVAHTSDQTVAEYAGVEFLPAWITWAPFSTRQPEPMGDVDEFPGLTPEELRDLAAEVGAHSGRLYSKANELDRIRRRQA
ncbi:hypothetical protein AB0D14_01955 [Streptomyces sp. NPDC048484]|uniref:DUF6907 domain-containing protein n=1 Tax=Streptomyces sp. NPDC048484 TaxID=3155146 RepID=UPI00341E49E7